MAREFAETFYNSPAWKRTRMAYAASVGGLCERCKARGIIRAGDTVHHKTHISQANINDPTITLDWNNLQLLCRDCHAAVHKLDKRYRVDDLGRVITI